MNKYDVLIDAQHFDKLSEALAASEKASSIFVLKTSDDPIKLEIDLSDLGSLNKNVTTLEIPVAACEDIKMTMTYASAYLRAAQDLGILSIFGRAVKAADTSNIISGIVDRTLKAAPSLRIFTDREGMTDIVNDIFEDYTNISLISSTDEMPKETHGMRGPGVGFGGDQSAMQMMQMMQMMGGSPKNLPN